MPIIEQNGRRYVCTVVGADRRVYTCLSCEAEHEGKVDELMHHADCFAKLNKKAATTPDLLYVTEYLAKLYREYCQREAAQLITEAGQLMIVATNPDSYDVLRASSSKHPIRVPEGPTIWASEEQYEAYKIFENQSERRGYLPDVKNAIDWSKQR